MNVNDQNRSRDVILSARSRVVMLSAAKHLTRRPPRCFAALSMTTLDRFWSFTFIIGGGRDQSAPTVLFRYTRIVLEQLSHLWVDYICTIALFAVIVVVVLVIVLGGIEVGEGHDFRYDGMFVCAGFFQGCF